MNFIMNYIHAAVYFFNSPQKTRENVYKKRRRAQSQPLQIVCVSYSVSISTLAAFIIKVRARLRAGNSPTKTNNSLAPPSQKFLIHPKKKIHEIDQEEKRVVFRPTLRCVCSVAARTARLLLSAWWCGAGSARRPPSEEAPAASPLRAPCAPRRALSADVPPVCFCCCLARQFDSLRTICCVHPSKHQAAFCLEAIKHVVCHPAR
jgi:hypothetical protein